MEVKQIPRSSSAIDDLGSMKELRAAVAEIGHDTEVVSQHVFPASR